MLHGVVAIPAYDAMTVALTSPAGMVTGDVAATQSRLRGVNVTLTPAPGAATGLPLLSSRTVSVSTNVDGKVDEPSMMLRFARVAAAVWSMPKSTVDPVIVAVPGATPETMALAVCCPCAIVTVGVSTPTAAGLSLTSVTVTPPAGAGVEIWRGREAVPPNGTLSTVGMLSTCTVTSTVTAPAAYPDAVARTVVEPEDKPYSHCWVVVPASAMNRSVVSSPTMDRLSAEKLMTAPFTPAGAVSVTVRSALSLSRMRSVPARASRMVGLTNVAVAVNTAGVTPLTVAVAVWLIRLIPSVHVACVRPAASVELVAGVRLPSSVAQVTAASATGLPAESRTSTTKGSARAVPAVSVCALPDTMITVSAGPTVPVAWNTTSGSPVRLAVSVLRPGAPRVQLPTVAMPDALLTADPPVTEPPPWVTANVTVTPLMGVPLVSRTSTAGATGTAVCARTVWPFPSLSVIWVTPPAPVPSARNWTGVRPVTVAVRALSPAAGPRVQLPTAASPAASVVSVAPVTAPPPCVTAKTTCTPGTGLAWVSVTRTLGAVATAVPTSALWLFPATIVTAPGPVACEVAVNTADAPARAGVVAVTLWLPTRLPRVHVTPARPAPSVSTESADTLPPPRVTANLTH